MNVFIERIDHAPESKLASTFAGRERRERLGWVGVGLVVGLGWVGLGWVGLGWVGLGWVGLGWVGLGWVGWRLVGGYIPSLV